MQNLRAYYFLILIAAFLSETKAETWRELTGSASSYEGWVKARPVFKTIERELDDAGLDALVPLEGAAAAKSGHAFSDEIAAFVARRSGQILSPFTLLKSDYFSGLQKMSLPERVDGAPNYRKVRMLGPADTAPATPVTATFDQNAGPLVYGVGMPTLDG